MNLKRLFVIVLLLAFCLGAIRQEGVTPVAASTLPAQTPAGQALTGQALAPSLTVTLTPAQDGTPTPFPPPKATVVEGLVTYQDPFNVFFMSIPETARKKPGDRPALFQLRDGETLMFFEKKFFLPPSSDDLQDLVEALIYVRLNQEKLADRQEIVSQETKNNFLIIAATYFLQGEKQGDVRLALRTSESTVYGLMLITPDFTTAKDVWNTVTSSFKLVSAINTPLPASSDLQSLSTSGGEMKTLPDEVRDSFRVPQGEYYLVEDFDQSLAQIGAHKAMGMARYPQNFVIRTNITWWNASGSVNWSEAGCGFVFRYTDRNNYYIIYWALDGKTYLRRISKGQVLNIFDGLYNKKNQARGEATIMLSVSGAQVTAFVNNRRIYRAVDSPLKSSLTNGELGLAVFSGTSADYGTRCKMTNTELWEVKQP